MFSRRHVERAPGGRLQRRPRSAARRTALDELERTPWRQKLTSTGAWSDAASYTIADITMLRKELVIGYAVAGFLAVLVPMDVWNDVFFTGHGFWTTLQNVILGPFIAFISFVCSVGNVPMAAALWHGGISFGGVISFIFADLIALPLVLIYRKYYGRRLALRLFFTFWLVMSTAGLIVEGTVRRPRSGSRRRDRATSSTPASSGTTRRSSTSCSSLVFGVLYWLYRNRDRLRRGRLRRHAFDPICGMQVRIADAPASRRVTTESWSRSARTTVRSDSTRRRPARTVYRITIVS